VRRFAFRGTPEWRAVSESRHHRAHAFVDWYAIDPSSGRPSEFPVVQCETVWRVIRRYQLAGSPFVPPVRSGQFCWNCLKELLDQYMHFCPVGDLIETDDIHHEIWTMAYMVRVRRLLGQAEAAGVLLPREIK